MFISNVTTARRTLEGRDEGNILRVFDTRGEEIYTAYVTDAEFEKLKAEVSEVKDYRTFTKD